jgi:hypothetical protein
LDTVDPNNPLAADRGCTDWWCCPIMLAVFLGCGLITGSSYINGAPGKLIAGYDNMGLKCGQYYPTNDHTQYKYKFLPFLL